MRTYWLYEGYRKKLKTEVFSVLDMVNLTDAANKKVGELSGGMLRRLGIAQALLGKPEILIVDEPTAGLDPEERLRFRNIVKNIKDSSIIIISTHIVEDVASTCDNVIIINKGDILKKGKIQDVKKSNKTYVWKVYISVEEFDMINKNFRVLEYEKREDGYDVKLLSNIKPMDTAKELEPTLEDVYMSIINEK
ncbi:ATP-binding cassette domain-containing protein [Caloramator sp. ALD01]|uniref:ATP-binding cassette domain-containing protein n=1 Tax=Caloramator sp. ALD01 TaxID=1031288 RepID=UPI00211090E1|nr:ATP-binding cassette domain-containing protein [Caloramator sp. ALD01]